MSKYDFGSSSDSSGNNGGNDNGGDRGYAPSFKIAPFIKLSGELSRLPVGNSDWGQSIAVTYDNGKLYDGILTTRTDKDEYKVFSWKDAPVIEDETLSCEQLPPVLNKTYGGTAYKYEILAARLEGDDEVGFGDDAFIKGKEFEGTGPIPLAEVLENENGDPEDRFTVWESASEHGPNSCAKTTVKCLSTAGSAAVVDANSQNNWLADEIELRPELVGMEIIYAKVQKESNESDNSFFHPVFIDSAVGEMILPDNDSSGDSSPAQEAAQDAADEAEDNAEVESPPGDSTAVAEFYDTCQELEIDTEPAVLGLLEDMVADEDNDLSDDMVDRDAIVADLVA